MRAKRVLRHCDDIMRTCGLPPQTHTRTHTRTHTETVKQTPTHAHHICTHSTLFSSSRQKVFPSHAREFQPTQRVPTHPTTTHPLSLSQNPPFYPAMVARRPTSVRPFHRGPPPTPANPSLYAVNSNKCITFGPVCTNAGRQPRETSESNAIISLIRQSGPRMRVLVYIIYKYIFRCVETRAFHCRPVGCIIFHAAQRPDIASNGIFIPSRVHHHHVCVCVRVRTRARRARVCFLFRRLKQSHIRNAYAYFYCAYVIYVLCPLLRRVRREFFVMG